MTPTLVALALLKLWLVEAQTLYAIGAAGHDDRLFLELARFVLLGEWLGPYSHMTLAKSPMYSIWIALTFLAGVPLLLAQHLLYVAACWAIVTSLKPRVSAPWLLVLLFGLLVFNPMTYEATMMARVLRQTFYVPLTMFIIACLVALHVRRERPLINQAPWAIGLGITLPAFWLTREEGLWVLPAVLLMTAALLVAEWRARRDGWRKRIGLYGLPFGMWAAGLLIVATLNYLYYGVFTTVESRSAEFQAAFGALTRVEHAHWRRYIGVPAETRERIYKVSPAFRELRPYLEGNVGLAWAAASELVTHEPAEKMEMGVGWFMWALRDAVAAAGYCYYDGRTAMRYYARLAREVNQACEVGLLRCGPRRASFMPPWRAEYLRPLWDSVRTSSRALVTFQGFSVRPPPSAGSEELLVLFRDLTRERITPIAPNANPLPQQGHLDATKLRYLEGVGRIYQRLNPPATLAALLAFFVATAIRGRQRKWSILWLVNTSLVSAIGAVIAVVSLVDAMAFPAVTVGYLSPAYPLMLLFLVTSAYDLRTAVGR